MEEVSEFCSSCKKYINAANFTSHSAYCQRNVKVCNVCGEPIHKDLIEEHAAEYHISVPCDLCSVFVEKWMLPKHQEECKMQPVFCEFCNSNLPFNTYAEHIDFCESRTEECPVCSKYIILKNKKKHSEFHLHEEKSVLAHPGHANMSKGTSQNDLHSGGEHYNFPLSEASDFYPHQHFPRNSQRAKQSLTSSSSAQSTRTGLLINFKHLSKNGNEKTLATNVKYPPADGMSGGTPQKDYYLPPLPYSMNSQQVNPSLASASSTSPTRKPLPTIGPFHFKTAKEETLATNKKLPEQSQPILNINPSPVFPFFLTELESNSPESYFVCHLCCENVLQKNRDMHLSSTCKMLQEQIPCDFYECPLCNDIMLVKDKTVHESFECRVLIENNQGSSNLNSEDEIHFSGMKTYGKTEISQENIPEKYPNFVIPDYVGIDYDGLQASLSAELEKKKNKLKKLSKEIKENMVGIYPTGVIPSYSGYDCENLLDILSAEEAILLKKMQEKKNKIKELSEKVTGSCPTCNKFFKLYDYHLHFPSCTNTSQKASNLEQNAQNLQKNKSEADLKAKEKFEQSLKSLTTNFCNEQKMAKASKNKNKNCSDSNEVGNGLRAKQPCKMKLGNYPIFSAGEQTADSFHSSLASASTSRGISLGKETNTFSDNNSEAKGFSEDFSEVKLPKCIICTLNDRSIVFQPCGHLVVCSNCAKIRMFDCPVCRERIRSKLKTYIS